MTVGNLFWMLLRREQDDNGGDSKSDQTAGQELLNLLSDPFSDQACQCHHEHLFSFCANRKLSCLQPPSSRPWPSPSASLPPSPSSSPSFDLTTKPSTPRRSNMLMRSMPPLR